MLITTIKALSSEVQGFYIERATIGNQYIFIHFLSHATIHIGNEEFDAPPGTCVLYDKFSRQRLTASHEPLLHNWCHITGELGEMLDRCGFKCNQVYHTPKSARITELFLSLDEEYQNQDSYSQRMVELRFEELLVKILRCSLDNNMKTNIQNEIKQKFIALHDEITLTHADTSWDIPKMAARVNFSPSRFHKLYKDIFGSPPNYDLQRIRIEHAKALALQGNYSVGELAKMVGFSNEYHFIRQFKKITGLTPGQYKSQI